MGYKLGTPNLLTIALMLFILTCTSTLAFSEVLELTTTQDTYVNSRRSTSSYDSNKYIRVRESRRSQREGLVKFDLSDIAQGSEIEKAELWLYVAYKRGSGILTVSEILEDWDETVNWRNKPEASGQAEDSAEVRQRGIYYKFDLTSLSQDWVDGVVENNGIHIGLEDSAYIIINSANNSANEPKLKITYSEPETEPEPSTDTTSEPDSDSDPVNTVQPFPNPEPQPEPVGDTGVSDAPLTPSNKRVLIVSHDGSGDYTGIQAALNASVPGDTIQVKDGVYEEYVRFNNSGTRDLPITLMNYPGHSPVIDPGGGSYPQNDSTLMVDLRAEWIILEGFEIRNGWNGVKIYEPHNTVRGNWIHDNRYQGILIVSAGDIFVDGNTINNNGTAPGACYSSDWGGESPRHCHGIYISDYFCDGAPRITVRGNVIRNHGGGGVHWNGSGCSSSMGGNLLENNIIEDNTWGMMLFYNVNNSKIRNNTFVTENIAVEHNSSYTFFSIWGSSGNQIKNNIFYSTKDQISAIIINDSQSAQNTFDYNLWNVSYEWWVWKGSWRNDFHSNFKNVTDWGQNSWCCSVDPDFISLSQKNYRIRSDSPAVDTGTNQECASIDLDGQQRIHGQSCDIGADEFM